MVEVKSIKEYASQIQTDIEGKTNQTTPALSISYNKIISNAVAALALTNKLHNIDQRKECFPQTASEDVGLPLWATLVNRARNTGTAAQLQVQITGTDDTVVGTGSVGPKWQNSSGLIYETLSGARIADGVASISLVCESTGTEGTLSVDDTLSIISTMTGIDDTATVTAINVVGADDEELEDWRSAIIHKAAFPPDIGTCAWFYYQALTVDGITRAYPYVNQSYPGQVNIYLVADDNDDGTPSDTQIADVLALFDDANKNIMWASGTLPNGEDRITVAASPVEEYVITISDGTPNLSDDMKTLIEDAIQNYADTRNPSIEGLQMTDTGIMRAIEISALIENVIESNSSETGNFTGLTLSLDGTAADYYELAEGTRPSISVEYT